LSLLREWKGDRPVPQWQHWIVAVEPTGRITLPSGARQVLGSDCCAQAVTREGTLILHRQDGGASLAIDRRGRLILPAWLRIPARSSGSVLIAARAVDTPAVVVAPTGVLEASVETARALLISNRVLGPLLSHSRRNPYGDLVRKPTGRSRRQALRELPRRDF